MNHRDTENAEQQTSETSVSLWLSVVIPAYNEEERLKKHIPAEPLA